MQEIALCVSIFLSGIVVGAMLLLYNFVRTAKAESEATVKEYNDILKKVSEMNLSMGSKILQIEEKISTLEFWKQTSAQPTNSFKVK